MNFQNIVPVERGKEHLDAAFRKAREKSNKKLEGDWKEKIKKKEMIKLDVVKAELVNRLDIIVKGFPNLERLPKFYRELIKLTLEEGELKRALGGVSWAIGKIRFFHKEHVRKISRSREAKEIKPLSRGFYGRISSLMKQIDRQLLFLEESRRVMRKYPDIKEMPTVVIFGFPNVGKTTLLNKLTGARGKVEDYAFTTKGINSGFWEVGDKKIQVLDVPGTLARREKRNEIEKIAYLAMEELAGAVVYVMDLSGQSSYGKKEQEELLRQLEKKKVLIYLSKRELIGEEKAKRLEEEYQAKGLKVVGMEGLKEEIEKLLE